MGERLARESGGALDGLKEDATTAGLRAFGLLQLTEMHDPSLLLDPYVPQQAVSAALMRENQQLKRQLAEVRQDVVRLEERLRSVETANSNLRSDVQTLRHRVDAMNTLNR
eukprot:GDKI01033071.1.p2 GENE.GDKI01033071.1~~GDKI01033071.1.p2  ORF type:complete len:111 (-),score=35.87 GDKI01033071.1:156-488(-)